MPVDGCGTRESCLPIKTQPSGHGLRETLEAFEYRNDWTQRTLATMEVGSFWKKHEATTCPQSANSYFGHLRATETAVGAKSALLLIQ